MATGTLYTISAPSGAGKTSLVKALLEKMENIGVSISHTTRDMRPGEEHGKDYFFIDATAFLDMIASKQFLEHAKVFRNYYGTSKAAVDTMLHAGNDVILEIDWQGMQQVKELCPDCVSISILPPSLEALASRLSGRQTDSQEEIDHRMSQAKEEMSHAHECDYMVINDDFDVALNELCAIVSSLRLSKDKQCVRHAQLLKDLTQS
jgi:guanylate kinase